MARKSITLANQNDEWLKVHVAKEEFTGKSEAVNYLIKQARERDAYHDYVQMKIDRGLKVVLVQKRKKSYWKK